MKSDGLKWIWGVLGPFAVIWSLTVWALIAKAVDSLPFFGKVDVNSAIVYSIPVVGVCLILLANVARRYATKRHSKSVRHRIIYSMDKIEGPDNWILTGMMLIMFLLIPFIVETLLILHMNWPERMSIWDREQHQSLLSIYQIPDSPFEFMRFRWDIHAGITAVPFYQPCLYMLLYLGGGCATISTFCHTLRLPLIGTEKAKRLE